MKKTLNHQQKNHSQAIRKPFASYSTKGSILIWSVMLGFVMTTVFFFFGTRQRASILVQRDTATILNTRTYLESYRDYLKSEAAIAPVETDTIAANYDEIKGTATKLVDEIVGIVDNGETITYTFSDTIFVEWNKCDDNNKSDLMVNGVVYLHDESDECTGDEEYDDLASALDVGPDFTIETLNAPIEYLITGNGTIPDNSWHVELEKDLDYGRVVKVEDTF